MKKYKIQYNFIFILQMNRLNNNWQFELNVDDKVDALDSSPNSSKYKPRWFQSKIVKKCNNKFKIHFIGWNQRFDEYISIGSKRIMPLHSKTKDWKSKLKVGNIIEVKKILETPDNKYKERWCKGIIRRFNNGRVLLKFPIENYPSSWHELNSENVTYNKMHIRNMEIYLKDLNKFKEYKIIN